jgi:hypothetical protein
MTEIPAGSSGRWVGAGSSPINLGRALQAARTDAERLENTLTNIYQQFRRRPFSWTAPTGTFTSLISAIDSASSANAVRSVTDVDSLLAAAGTRARLLSRQSERAPSSLSDSIFSVELALFRAVHESQEITKLLDQAIDAVTRRSPRASSVVRTKLDGDGAHAATITAPLPDDFRASVKPIAVTLPGTLVGIAVLLLPGRHRSRYAEEFRAEVRDLPHGEQVGYSWRQCLFAVSLRYALIRPIWQRRHGGRGKSPREHGSSR